MEALPMKKLVLSIFLGFALVCGSSSQALFAACTDADKTGFIRDGINMTALMINPADTVTGPVDATGCNIGVYFDHNLAGQGTVDQATIHGANYFGVLVNGDDGIVGVDITNSQIHDIGEVPLNGTQHGVAVYYRAFNLGGSASGTISGNTLTNYQKGGIVANGQGPSVVITGNTVTGQGPVNYIAQNGIQVGWGANASVMRNNVSGHSYTGTSTASGGIIVVGGAGYGNCPDFNSPACPYTVGTRIVGNTVQNNDVGIWLSNINVGPDYLPPTSATNIKAVNNIISSNALTNGIRYQAGIADQGNNDKLINNNISGDGYNSVLFPDEAFAVDADTSFTNRPKVHANSFDGVKTN
jgi:hypothetical protein